jgi:hypothetical protein
MATEALCQVTCLKPLSALRPARTSAASVSSRAMTMGSVQWIELGTWEGLREFGGGSWIAAALSALFAGHGVSGGASSVWSGLCYKLHGIMNAHLSPFGSITGKSCMSVAYDSTESRIILNLNRRERL